jgi:hypothetical protein
MTGRLRSVPRQARAAVLTWAICVGALAAPASAPAAVTIGQTAPSAGSAGGCTASLYVQHQVAGPPTYTVPDGGGVVTSWSVQGGTSPFSPLKLKLVRRAADGTSYVIVAEDTFRPITQGVLNTFPTQIPVTGGEILSIWSSGGSGCMFSTAAEGDHVRYRGGSHPEPAIGELFPTDTEQNFGRLNVSAVVEPDCDSDGFGDETQDPSLLGGDCPLRGRNLTLDANRNKVKKGKRVTLTGRIAELARQGECQSGQTVQLQRKRPRQTAFTTVQQLQTDAAGSFSTRRKVKKTFQYRAQVIESGGCDAQTSNTEKVKVKKKS